jgi:hypothetical protein
MSTCEWLPKRLHAAQAALPGICRLFFSRAKIPLDAKPILTLDF